MTENEALEVGKSLYENITLKGNNIIPVAKYIEFVRMAIQALEEIQQYRAIGTVEGYERAIQSSIENYNLYKEYKAKVQDFEAIGTVEEFKALKEKEERFDRNIKMFNEIGLEVRNNAIDETCLKIFNHLLSEIEWNRVLVDDWDALAEEFKEIAEQMKGSEENE